MTLAPELGTRLREAILTNASLNSYWPATTSLWRVEPTYLALLAALARNLLLDFHAKFMSGEIRPVKHKIRPCSPG
jgi:hypothetical protein